MLLYVWWGGGVRVYVCVDIERGAVSVSVRSESVASKGV